ncbi:MAG: GNAT family N-acetyltransferase [Acholeplasmataceae bacterium]|jgi:RimJ/RimL family protein N-acetyltransferase|nr:GNAT family N-acetyltransferase [Acholeplasmataceae bacterium]
MKRLETDRLILRALSENDLDDFFNYCQKETVGPNAGWRPHQSIEESLRILNMMISENEVWGIELKENNRLIGTIGLHVRNFDNALANRKEIGYVLDDTYWGYGFMTEAVNAVLDFAFNDLELSEVVVGHATTNLRSKRVIEKTGFIYTHVEERDHFDGTKIKIYMYQLTKETWRNKK